MSGAPGSSWVEGFDEMFDEGVGWSEDAEAFEALLDPPVEARAQRPVPRPVVPAEHAPGHGDVLKAGKVGPKVDGSSATAKIAVVAPAAYRKASEVTADEKKFKARFKAASQTITFEQAPGAPFSASPVHPSGGYQLAGTDAQRWEATKWGLFDASTQAMVCVRGGYGVPRFLWDFYMYVSYDKAQKWKNPKRFAGYSDITALLLAAYSRMGWAGIHGPLLVDASRGNDTMDSLVAALTKEPKDLYPGNLVADGLKMGDDKTPDQTIRGVLLGGNLTHVAALYGSPFFPSIKGGILLLEEVHEKDYAIDRMLQALWLRQIVKEVKAVVVGTCHDCGLTPAQLAELIAATWKVPVASGLEVGHGTTTTNRALWHGLEHKLVIQSGKAKLYLVP